MAHKPLHEGITVQTIPAVASAPGHTFDVVFRKKDASSTLCASEEVRAKLAERQLTQADVDSAVHWARTQAPSL